MHTHIERTDFLYPYVQCFVAELNSDVLPQVTEFTMERLFLRLHISNWTYYLKLFILKIPVTHTITCSNLNSIT